MSTARFQSLADFQRHRADVGVRCKRASCGRLAVFDAAEVLAHFGTRGWRMSMAELPRRFRCLCGSREVRISPIPVRARPEPLPSRRAVLLPIYDQESDGVASRVCRIPVEAILSHLGAFAIREQADMDLSPELERLLSELRPSCGEPTRIDDLVRALAEEPPERGRAVRAAIEGIMRQYGRATG